jgi:hypothetical protein
MANLPTATKRAAITKPDKDDGNYHIAQVDYMGKVCDVEIITPYGLYSNTPKDGVAIIWNVQGQEENRVGISNTPKTRFKDLKPGEVVVGSPQTLSNAKFFTDGKIVVTGKGNSIVTIDASGNVTITTDGTMTAHSVGAMTLQSDGQLNLTATGNIVAQAANIYLNGSSVGVARLGDSVAAGVITSASSTVKTG